MSSNDERSSNNDNNHPSESKIYSCDRRLSRAARAILVNKTLPILQHYDERSDETEMLPPLSAMRNSDKVEYYQIAISSLMNNPSTCLLNPKRDMYWHDEHLHTIQYSRGKTYHVCGLCGKKFVSKYYLDLHVDTKHQDDKDVTLHDNSNNEICPSTELCERLGGETMCQKKAIEEEPYYAPGLHNEYSFESQSIKRKFQNLIHEEPCSDRHATFKIKKCYEMIETCFGGNKGLVNDLNSLLCDTQSCHHQLHSLFHYARSIHDGREYWDSHHDDINSIGYPLIIFVIAAVMFFCWMSLPKIIQKRKKKLKMKFN